MDERRGVLDGKGDASEEIIRMRLGRIRGLTARLQKRIYEGIGILDRAIGGLEGLDDVVEDAGEVRHSGEVIESY